MKAIKHDKFLIKRSAWLLITVFFAVFFLISVVGSSVANDYAPAINGRLGLSNVKKVTTESDENTDSEYFKSDYYKSDGSYDNAKMRANSERVGLQTAVEGSVLLWNDDNTLPLKEGSKVSLFGVSTVNYVFSGSGSGQMWPNPRDGSMLVALTKNGIAVNSALNAKYLELSKNYQRTVNCGANDLYHFGVNEVPWDVIEPVVSETAASYGDAAIMTVSRTAGEFADILENVSENFVDENNYLDLSERESKVLSELNKLKAQKKIKKIILLLNGANAMQFAHIRNDYGVDACLWVGEGGDMSFRQIADALTAKGDYTLSGRLPDTFVYYNRSNPSYTNYGDFTFSEIGAGVPKGSNSNNTSSVNSKYVVYQEGIYVGYRYYETRYEDAVLGRGNAVSAVGASADADKWEYTKEVAFPFGYGLSYTDFTYGKPVFVKTDKGYDVSMEIRNDGNDHAGKDVMQVYLQKPYTDYDMENGIEKSAVELVGFAKTDKLERGGGKQILTVSIDEERFKTYDAYGKGTYILEEGDYYLAVGTNAHDALNNILAAKKKTTADGMDYDGDEDRAFKIHIDADDHKKYSVSTATEKPIVNLFDNADINLYEGTKDQKIQYLSRKDWQNTFPSEAVKLKCTDPVMVEDMQYGKKVEVKEGDALPVYGKTTAPEGELSLAMFMELSYDNGKWQNLLDQLTLADQQLLCSYGLSNLAAAVSVGAPGSKANDGPQGFRTDNNELKSTFGFPCPVVMAATFNTPLIERLGNAYGMEALHIELADGSGQKYAVAYAPGANTHRSAYAGRNFEYYSEDGELGGLMLAAQVKGMQNRGLIVITKHFVLNDQESFRYGITTWANEQSIREIYCRPFEIAVVNSKMNGIMSAFNRIGCTWTGRHKGLLTDLLRGEWGFTGIVETDSTGGDPKHMCSTDAMANALVAGNDVWMAGNGSDTYFKGLEDNPTVMLAMREACHRILYAQLHSSAMNGTDSNTRFVNVTVWWQNALIALQAVSGVIFGLLLIVTVFAYFYCSKAWVRVCERAAARNAVPPKTKGEAFWRKHKYWIIPVAAVLVIAIVLVGVLVPIYGNTNNGHNGITPTAHVCEHKCEECGKCTNYDCLNPVCADKCGGHEAHKNCPVCGKCIDYECEKHTEKCGDGKSPYVFEAESPEVEKTGETLSVRTDNGVTYVSGMNDKAGYVLSFRIESSADTTATLSATVCKRLEETVFTNLHLIEVNDAVVYSPATVAATGTGSDTWTDFIEVKLGCVRLQKGINTVKITTLSNSAYISSYNFDKITLYSDASLSQAKAKSHYCDICGKCIDNDCTDCETHCGEGEGFESYKADSSKAVLTAGTKGLPSVNNRNGNNLIENFNGNVGATATFEFYAEQETVASLIISSTRRHFEVRPTNVYEITVNGVKAESGGILKSGGGDSTTMEMWYTPVEVNLGCVRLIKGTNKIKVKVLYDEDIANNLAYVSLRSESEVHIPVAIEKEIAPTCTKEGMTSGLKCEHCNKVLEERKPISIAEHERKLVKVDAEIGVCALPGHPAYWQCANCREVFADEAGQQPTTLEEIYGTATHDCAPCAICGKCTDDNCDEPDCLDKCPGKGAHRLAVTDAVLGAANNGATPSFNGGAHYNGADATMAENFSGNEGASLTFKVNMRADGKVRLVMTSTMRGWNVSFDDAFEIYVNDVKIDTSALSLPVNPGGDAWFDLVDLDIGEITLDAGINEIKIVSRGGWACTNLGDIFVRTIS